MLIRTLLAATALAAPTAIYAQSMPGMDMGQHAGHTMPAPKAKPKPKAANPAPRPRPASAQRHTPTPAAPMDHGTMDHSSHAVPAPNVTAAPAAPAEAPTTSAPQDQDGMDHASMPGMDHGAMAGMDHAGMDMHGMKGMLGGYSMMRDASGTAWQLDSSPMWAIMGRRGDWSTMVHGYATLVYDDQSGPRGGEKTFVASMLMGMGQRELGGGTLTLKAMGSLDPLTGKSGYPLLLATGETADARTELVDRQHPHDAFMELSGTYSHPLGRDLSGFVYLGLPGEPALGPATYMHRFSGVANPEAPISHHWLDSTHVVFGRAENVDKDELFGDEGGDLLAGRVFNVGKLSIGGYHSVPVGMVAIDLGGLVSKYDLPRDIQPRYGSDPTSFMLFTRLRITG